MKLLYNKIFLEHYTGSHPESAERLRALGKLEESPIIFDDTLPHLVHTKNYIDRVKDTSAAGGSLDADTPLMNRSYDVALYAASAAVQAAETGDFALIRPPGHHAYADHGSGFCLFNNVAIAAKLLANRGKRVLIFDFDGHLGDGTSSIFYDSDEVLYVSIHQYPAFPYKGHVEDIGKGKGRGFTINVPIPPYSADDILFDAMAVLIPILKQFNPDHVLISAGFDAHEMDPLLQLRWSSHAYYQLGKLIRQNFNSYSACLEGGYNTEVLSTCITNFVNGINGKKSKGDKSHSDSEILVWNEYEIRLDNLLQHLKPYWKI